jgi:DNA gyrase/topoisomerase IV subunit A
MLPSIIDGLLPAHRRILLGAHTFCRNEFKKTPAVVGGVIANWHPHAESEGIAAWAVQNGFMDGSGSWGELYGTDPECSRCAAMRYTSLRANKFIEEMAFRYIDHVPWKEDELEPEPVALPTMIPFCLMGKIEMCMIAFGFKTEIPAYEMKDLITRLLWLTSGKKGKEPVIKPHLEQCTILSDDSILKDLLTKGQAKLDIKSNYTINEKEKKITVFGWSPRTKIQTIIDKFNRYNKWGLFSNGDIGYLDESDESGIKCVFEVARQRNTQDIFDKLVEAAGSVLTSTITYNIYVVDENGNPRLAGVDEMLSTAYNYHKWAFKNFLNNSCDENVKKINELKIIEAIRPHISNVYMGRDVNNFTGVCEKLSQDSGVKIEDILPILDKYRIKKLLTVDTDISQLENENIKLKDTLNNIDSACVQEYKGLYKRII